MLGAVNLASLLFACKQRGGGHVGNTRTLCVIAWYRDEVLRVGRSGLASSVDPGAKDEATRGPPSSRHDCM
jgi:hypothetical protein